MSSRLMDSVTDALEKTRVSPSGVSFAGKSLKLDNEDDAKQVVEEIDKCKKLEYLNLEGNTVGVEASKAIAKALEKHPELKQALWKDMFTGRMKTEIPMALQYFGSGLVTAKARLTVLDLSDNAFGPIGVEGLAALLRSRSCYGLEELRLNNNGLGITGGKLLASALTDCYKCSRRQGKPLALKVFIAGRNRLENEGAKALAHVFKMIGTLEEVAMPQNGIYHVGISALSAALTHNENLQILNLNDNTIGPRGAEAIAKALPAFKSLRKLNFGDCLLKTKGAILLANKLKAGHLELEELILGFNEIKKRGAYQLANAVANKPRLKILELDGNQFGDEGRKELRSRMKEMGKLNMLGSLEDDESEDEEEASDSEEEEEEEEESEESEESEEEVVEVEESTDVTVDDFLAVPSPNNFMALGDDRSEMLSKKLRKEGDSSIPDFLSIIMKVASLTNNSRADVAESSLKCAEILFRDLFLWSRQSDKVSIVNNTILVYLGLIKCEDKKFKIGWSLDGCLNVLNAVMRKGYVPESTKDTLKVFMQREIDRNGEFLDLKKQILLRLT